MCKLAVNYSSLGNELCACTYVDYNLLKLNNQSHMHSIKSQIITSYKKCYPGIT